MKQTMWTNNGYFIMPGSRLMANLKPGVWCEIHEERPKQYTGFVCIPTGNGGSKTYELPVCRTPATAKKRVEMALMEYDCLIDRTCIGRDKLTK